jgi:hypothetical protein
MYVSCEVRTSSTYRKVKLSAQQAVEAYMYASYEVRSSSTYKEVIPVTGRGGLYVRFL